MAPCAEKPRWNPQARHLQEVCTKECRDKEMSCLRRIQNTIGILVSFRLEVRLIKSQMRCLQRETGWELDLHKVWPPNVKTQFVVVVGFTKDWTDNKKHPMWPLRRKKSSWSVSHVRWIAGCFATQFPEQVMEYKVPRHLVILFEVI